MKRIFAGFTKFEFGLWISSLIIVTISFFCLPQKDYLTLTASLIGVTALIFVAKGRVIGQILCVVFALFYGIISFYLHYYGEMITYLCMSAPAAIMSVISWIRHPYGERNEVAVHRMTRKEIGIMVIVTVGVTIAFYYILGALGNANLLISTFSVTTSFLASYMTFLRSPWYAVGYASNDVILIVLWVLATIQDGAYFPMIICFFMFLINDLYGFINWRRMENYQKI